MRADQRQDYPRQQQDAQRVEPGNQGRAGEIAAEQGPVQPSANHRESQGDRRERALQPYAREEVVGQPVAEVTLEHGQDQQ